MKTQWPALLASGVAAVLGTAGTLRSAAAPSAHQPPAPVPVHTRMPMHMPGMPMHHGAAGVNEPRSPMPSCCSIPATRPSMVANAASPYWAFSRSANRSASWSRTGWLVT